MRRDKEEILNVMNERLTMLMKMHNLDVDSFAKKCGIEPEDFRAYMDGTKEMMIPELVKISKAMDVSADYIMGYYKYPFPVAKTEGEYALYKKLDGMSKEELREFADGLREKLSEEEA